MTIKDTDGAFKYYSFEALNQVSKYISQNGSINLSSNLFSLIYSLLKPIVFIFFHKSLA